MCPFVFALCRGCQGRCFLNTPPPCSQLPRKKVLFWLNGLSDLQMSSYFIQVNSKVVRDRKTDRHDPDSILGYLAGVLNWPNGGFSWILQWRKSCFFALAHPEITQGRWKHISKPATPYWISLLSQTPCRSTDSRFHPWAQIALNRLNYRRLPPWSHFSAVVGEVKVGGIANRGQN